MEHKPARFFLLWLILGIVSGIVSGGLFPQFGIAIGFVGDLFLRALLSLIVPLIITSLICGINGLGDVRNLGALGRKTLGYFLFTTLLASLLGIVLVHFFGPSAEQAKEMSFSLSTEALGAVGSKTSQQVFREIVTSFIPKNIFAAMANQEVVPLITVSLVAGSVLSTLGAKGAPVLAVFRGLNAMVMGMVHLLMRLAPVGIGALLAGRLGKAGGFAGFWPELMRLGHYTLLLVCSLLLFGFGVLPLFLKFFSRRAFWPTLKGMAPALTTAFSTSSSNATLPATMKAAIDNLGMSPRVIQFVAPLGATINLSGTALYEAMSAIYLAKLYGIHLEPMRIFAVFVTATLAAMGSAGIPEAGLVTMAIVLKAVDLPMEGLSLILMVDWIVDRFRTMVNVWADVVVAAIVENSDVAPAELETDKVAKNESHKHPSSSPNPPGS